ncbi:hypothetical protein GQ457_18G016720 [Hibiscus cannabinus]
MDVSSNLLLFSASLLLFMVYSSIQAFFRPKALVLPVSKVASTNQYVTQIKQRTPLVPINLTLDLVLHIMSQHESLWVECEQNYVSSTYKHALCNSTQCKLARSDSCRSYFDGPKPGCNINTCGLFVSSITTVTFGDVSQDVVAIQSTNGKSSGKVVSVSEFLFTCGLTGFLDGLANGVKGMAGLGRSKVSMPTLFSFALSFPRKFAICLGSSNGVLFFVDGPYSFLAFNTDISKSLVYTPLVLNLVSTRSGRVSFEATTSIMIGGHQLEENLLQFDLATSMLGFNSSLLFRQTTNAKFNFTSTA